MCNCNYFCYYLNSTSLEFYHQRIIIICAVGLQWWMNVAYVYIVLGIDVGHISLYLIPYYLHCNYSCLLYTYLIFLTFTITELLFIFSLCSIFYLYCLTCSFQCLFKCLFFTLTHYLKTVIKTDCTTVDIQYIMTTTTKYAIKCCNICNISMFFELQLVGSEVLRSS